MRTLSKLSVVNVNNNKEGYVRRNKGKKGGERSPARQEGRSEGKGSKEKMMLAKANGRGAIVQDSIKVAGGWGESESDAV